MRSTNHVFEDNHVAGAWEGMGFFYRVAAIRNTASSGMVFEGNLAHTIYRKDEGYRFAIATKAHADIYRDGSWIAGRLDDTLVNQGRQTGRGGPAPTSTRCPRARSSVIGSALRTVLLVALGTACLDTVRTTETHTGPYGLPPELLDAMAGSVCGGAYPDPRDPTTVPGLETPRRVETLQSK